MLRIILREVEEGKRIMCITVSYCSHLIQSHKKSDFYYIICFAIFVVLILRLMRISFIEGSIPRADQRQDHHQPPATAICIDLVHLEAHQSANNKETTISDHLVSDMGILLKKKERIRACQEILVLMKGEKV